MSFQEFWAEAKKMKMFSNEFDNPLSFSQFTRSVRPIVLLTSLVCLGGFVEMRF